MSKSTATPRRRRSTTSATSTALVDASLRESSFLVRQGIEELEKFLKFGGESDKSLDGKFIGGWDRLKQAGVDLVGVGRNDITNANAKKLIDSANRSVRESRNSTASGLIVLNEYASAVTTPSLKVDRDQGIIYGVKVVGRKSPNSHGIDGVDSTEYSPQALTAACKLYEGVKVNINHPDRDRPGVDRKAEDRIGKLVNCRMVEGELFADMKVLKSHPMSERLFEAAESMPDAFGLSHNALGRGEVRGTTYIITEIPEVRSVDVVADAGTVSSLFESQQMREIREAGDGAIYTVTASHKEGAPSTEVYRTHIERSAKEYMDKLKADGWVYIKMTKTPASTVESRKGKNPMKLRTLFENVARVWAPKFPNKSKRITSLLEMYPEEEKGLMEMPADDVPAEGGEEVPPTEDTVAADPDAAVEAGLMSACQAVLADTALDTASKLKKLKDLLNTKDKILADPAADLPAEDAEMPVEEAHEEEGEKKDEEKKMEESREIKALNDRIAILEADKRKAELEAAKQANENSVRRDIAAAGLNVGKEVFEALCEASPKNRKVLIERERQAAAAEQHAWPPISRSTLESREADAKRRAEEIKDGEAFAAQLLNPRNWGRN